MIFSALCAALCLAAPVLARELYVSPNGSDQNPGSEKSPWQSLQHAVDSAAPGDVILVKSGVYAGFRVRNSGTPQAWITLTAAPNAKAVVNRPGPRNPHKSNIEFETWEGEGMVAYWLVQGLEVTDAPRHGMDLRGSAKKHSHHITLRGNLVHDCGLSGIFTAFVDHALVEGNQSHHNQEHGIYLSNSGDFPVVIKNTLNHNAACGLQLNADRTMGGDGIITKARVEENLIYANGLKGGAGINLDGVTDSLIANNTLEHNLAGGIALYRANGAVASRNNQVLGNRIRMPEKSRWALNLAQPDCINNRLGRNLIFAASKASGSICLPAPDLAGFASDHNQLTPRFSIDGGGTIISLDKWQALGHDRHSTALVKAPAKP